MRTLMMCSQPGKKTNLGRLGVVGLFTCLGLSPGISEEFSLPTLHLHSLLRLDMPTAILAEAQQATAAIRRRGAGV